jgi:uncharacterized repeat protein (TIGR03803 family)
LIKLSVRRVRQAATRPSIVKEEGGMVMVSLQRAMRNLGMAVLATVAGSWALPASAQSLKVLRTFENLGCASSDTLLDNNGNLFLTVGCGGQAGRGALIRVAADGTVVILYSFKGGSDGDNPRGTLLRADGAFYGTTHSGGSGPGTIYRVARDGTYALLHRFDYGSEGGFPLAGLVRDSDGNLYGTTSSGGPDGEGTTYRLAPDGTFTILHSFSFTDGKGFLPSPGLVRDGQGNLYGTTYSGGAFGGTFGNGVLYKLAPDGSYTVLHDFTGDDGVSPFGLVRVGNLFYGVTQSGGAAGQGTLFKLTHKGVFSVLCSFTSRPGGLAADDLGNLFVNHPQGGSLGQGALSRVTPTGAVSTVYEFTGTDDGSSPLWRPFVDALGSLYGASTFGQGGAYANVFKVETNGSYTTLRRLTMTSLNGDLALDSNGNLFGTTQLGGVGLGSVFSYAPVSKVYTELYAFNAPTESGQGPVGGPLLDATGMIYGTTSAAGSFGGGTIFKLDPDATFNLLHQFGDFSIFPPDARMPLAGLAADGSGALYGTASSGGSFGAGAIFKLGAGGTYTVLHDFGFADGAQPTAGVVVDASGAVYGTASQGGPGGAGIVFKIGADGTFSILHAFAGPDGASPQGAVALDSTGNLYGTTSAGGAASLGNVFKVAPDGTFTSLHEFMQAEGAAPMGSVIRDASGTLFGTTSRGGALDLGTIFRLAADGTHTVLYSFTGDDGASPRGGLKLYGRTLYGTASMGGKLGGGCLFQLRL